MLNNTIPNYNSTKKEIFYNIANYESWNCKMWSLFEVCKGKGKVSLYNRPLRPRGWVEVSWPRHLGGGGWSTPHPGRFTPGKDPVPIVQEAGWASGPVWTGVENLGPTGIWSPDRPARSESLYRLSYPGPFEVCMVLYFIFSSIQTLQ